MPNPNVMKKSSKILRILVIGMLLFLTGCQTTKQEPTNFDFFNETIHYAQEAQRFLEAAPAGTTQEIHKNLVQFRELQLKALESAKKVDTERLNRDYAGLGDHFKSELTKSIELFIESVDESSGEKFKEAMDLYNIWDRWAAKTAGEKEIYMSP